MSKGKKKVDIKKKSLKELLGPAPFEDEDENLKPQIGVVRGLAWTSVGGDTLSIEVNVMPGKGKMELTGCMGDVMKESAQIGLSYVRSIAEHHGIDSDYFEKHDIHLHIFQKLSHRCTICRHYNGSGNTSAITDIPVRGDIAMTGEITLRGKVLPIGGLKEKLLAAKIVGVKEVLVPARNKRNVAELDEEIISGLKITYVEEMNEGLNAL
ncbi:MAG: S16 family serine protease [Anaerobutyricum sp.]